MSSEASPPLRHTPARIVVKIGTSTLCDKSGSPDPVYLGSVAAQIDEMRRGGAECVVVTSGAIRAGLDQLTLRRTPRSIPLKQAAAAIGQGRLMGLYAEAFAPFGVAVAQILLTRDDFHERRRYVHAANTLRALLKLGVIPIVNENDSTAVDEIKVGDNDTLAALVAGLVDADLLILLSDIDGLYTSDPGEDADATLIPLVDDLSAVASMVGVKAGDWGTGGMRTKIDAAALCLRSCIPMVIANGRRPGVIEDAVCGRAGTRFEPTTLGGMPARKRWIAGGQRPAGALAVHEDACAQLLSSGRSLLPAGVIGIEGDFAAGSVVVLTDRSGKAFARGIVNYPHDALRAIMGLKTNAVHDLYGPGASDEVVHRDNLVLLQPARK